jgi:hypothetical protein
MYDGIGFRSTLNGNDPVHPVQQEVCTGCGAEPTENKPLVNGRCTGCTGTTPFKTNGHAASPRFCLGCGTYFATNGHHSDDCTAVKKEGVR